MYEAASEMGLHIVARLLPPRWHRKVFCDNPCDLFDWEKPLEPARATAEPLPVAG
jgi:hypothetical protein